MNDTVVKLEDYGHITMEDMSRDHRINQGITGDKVKINGKESTNEDSLTPSCSPHHAETKKFICNVCNKQYTLQSSLNSHMNTHTKERKYMCDICNKEFLH